MKRIISLLLALIMCVSMFTITSAQEVKDLTDDQKTLLKAIGFFEESMDLTANVTRGEFANYLVNSIYDEAEYLIGEERFSDVTEAHPYFAEITLLKHLKVSVGDENGNFNPDSKITADEAIILAVRFLGYELYAQRKGYTVVAAEKNLYKNLSLVNGQPVSLRDALALVVNVLNADVADQYYVNSLIYTFMQQHRKLYKAKGIVTDDGLTSVLCMSELGTDEIVIENTKFKNLTGETGLFGYNVIAYYEINKEDNIPQLIAVTKEKSNESLVIKADCLAGFTPETNTYEYYTDEFEKEDTEEIQMPFGITVIYNGVAVETGDKEFTEKSYIPENGSIILFDNDGDGHYDILFINSYDTYIVSDIDIAQEKIYTKDNKGTLELNKKMYTIEGSQGESISLSELAEGSIITVSSSFNKKVVRIFVSTEMVNNVVTGMDNEGNLYISNENKCELSEYFINLAYEKDKDKNINDKYESVEECIDIGEIYTMYIDIFGKVVAMEKTTENFWNTGYLINSGKSSRGTLANEYRVKIYNSDLGIKDINLADKVNIYMHDLTESRETEEKTNEIIYNYLNNNTTNKYRLIRYRLNMEEEITRIEFPVLTDYETSGLKDRLCVLTDKWSEEVRNSGTYFPGVALTNSSTRVITVPQTATDNEDDYSTYGREYYSVSLSSNKFVAYSTNTDSLVASYVVAPADKGTHGQSSYLMISAMKQTYDREKGQNLYEIKGYLNGQENTYIVEDMSVINNALVIGQNATESKKLQVGDIINFSTRNTEDGKAVLTGARIVYDADGVYAGTGLGAFGEKYGIIPGSSSDKLMADSVKFGNPVAFTSTTTFKIATTVSGHLNQSNYRVLLGYVYSYGADGMIVTTQPVGMGAKYSSIANYSGDYVTECYTNVANKLTYSKKLSDKTLVRKGTEDDIKTYLSHGTECSKVMLVCYYGNLYGAYIID